jgi:hypothetical protein
MTEKKLSSTPLEYMEEVLKNLLDSICKNEQREAQFVSLSEEERAVLKSGVENCNQIIAMLTEPKA